MTRSSYYLAFSFVFLILRTHFKANHTLLVKMITFSENQKTHAQSKCIKTYLRKVMDELIKQILKNANKIAKLILNLSKKLLKRGMTVLKYKSN